MRRNKLARIIRTALLVATCTLVTSCDDPRVYGSVSFSSFSGSGWHGGGVGTSVTVGGRIR